MHVGLVGAGRIGAFHGRSLKESAHVDRLSVTDQDAGRAAALATELGATSVGDARALLAQELDALVIAAATPAHAELLHMAADAGVPTFCEKPIALDLDATDSVIAHVERAGAFVQIGFQRRFDRGYLGAREAVAGGSVGELMLLRLATHDPEPPPESYVAGSGGIWLDLAIHDFDIAAWVAGRRVVEVYADGEAEEAVFARHHDAGAACAVLRFEGGLLAAVTAARRDPLGYDVRREVFGTRDTVGEGWDGRIALRSLEPGMPPPAPGYRDFLDRFRSAYRAEIEAFLDAVKHRKPSPCPVADARHALVVALAAGRSMREHRPVRLEEVA